MEEWRQIENQALAATEAQKYDEAERLYQKAIVMAEDIFDQEPIVNSLLDISRMYTKSGKQEKVRDLLIRANDIGEKQLAEKTGNEEKWRLLTARCALELANYYRDVGHFQMCAPLYTRAERLCNGSADGGNELLLTVQTDHERMEQIRKASEGQIETAIGNGRMGAQSVIYEKGQAFGKRVNECSKLVNGPKSLESEKKFYALLADAKKAYGVREPAYQACLDMLAVYSIKTDQPGLIEPYLRDAIKELEHVEHLTKAQADKDPEKVADVQNLRHYVEALGNIRSALGDGAGAIEQRQRAIALRDRWGPVDFEYVVQRESLAALYVAQGKPELAMQEYEATEAVLNRIPLLKKSQDRTAWRLRLSIAASKARIEQAQGSFKEADRHLAELRNLLPLKLPGRADYASSVYMESAELAKKLHRADEEKRFLEMAIKYGEKAVGTDSAHLCGSLGLMGNIYAGRGDFNTAQKYFERMYKVATDTKYFCSGRTRWTRVSLQKLSLNERGRNNQAQAERYLDTALTVARTSSNPTEEIEIRLALGDLLQATGRYKEACNEYAKTWKLIQDNKALLNETHFAYQVWDAYALTKMRMGDLPGSIEKMKMALDAVANQRRRPELKLRCLFNIGQFYAFCGDFENALLYLDKASAYCKSEAIIDSEDLANFHLSSSLVYWLKGDNVKADTLARKARQYFVDAKIDLGALLLNWDADASTRFNFPKITSLPTTDRIVRLVSNFDKRLSLFVASQIKYCSIVSIWIGRDKDGQLLAKKAQAERDSVSRK